MTASTVAGSVTSTTAPLPPGAAPRAGRRLSVRAQNAISARISPALATMPPPFPGTACTSAGQPACAPRPASACASRPPAHCYMRVLTAWSGDKIHSTPPAACVPAPAVMTVDLRIPMHCKAAHAEAHTDANSQRDRLFPYATISCCCERPLQPSVSIDLSLSSYPRCVLPAPAVQNLRAVASTGCFSGASRSPYVISTCVPASAGAPGAAAPLESEPELGLCSPCGEGRPLGSARGGRVSSSSDADTLTAPPNRCLPLRSPWLGSIKRSWGLSSAMQASHAR